MLSRKYLKAFVTLFLSFGVFYLASFTRPSETAQTVLVGKHAAPDEAAASFAAPPAPPVVLDAYGFEQGAFVPEEHVIQRGESFAEILEGYGVPYEKTMQVVEAARPVLDVRRLRAGKAFRVYRDPADSLAARFLVYEKDAVNYVVFDLDEPVEVVERQRPVEVRQKAVGGVIEGSLYGSLARAGGDEALAGGLAEIFAWQVNFYRLRKGDRFQVVYEEKRVAGKPVGVGKILAARLHHGGEDHQAFYFEQDSTGAYYDENGESLKQAFLKAPLKYSRISSRYTKRRFHPVQKRYKPHLGTDFAAPAGTPIYAAGDGVVEAAGYTQGNGNFVKIRHNDTYTTGYLHMSRRAKGMRAGRSVQQGEVIGYVGSTGLATGPHLCYRFWKNGVQVDPFKQDLPTAEPLPETQRLAFERHVARLLPQLQREDEQHLAAL